MEEIIRPQPARPAVMTSFSRHRQLKSLLKEVTNCGQRAQIVAIVNKYSRAAVNAHLLIRHRHCAQEVKNSLKTMTVAVNRQTSHFLS